MFPDPGRAPPREGPRVFDRDGEERNGCHFGRRRDKRFVVRVRGRDGEVLRRIEGQRGATRESDPERSPRGRGGRSRRDVGRGEVLVWERRTSRAAAAAVGWSRGVALSADIARTHDRRRRRSARNRRGGGDKRDGRRRGKASTGTRRSRRVARFRRRWQTLRNNRLALLPVLVLSRVLAPRGGDLSGSRGWRWRGADTVEKVERRDESKDGCRGR